MDESLDDVKRKKMERMQEESETQVDVFTTPTCPYCIKLKQWLDGQGIDYTEHNVAQDREKAREMIQRTGQRGVPQTFVGDEAIIGFDPSRIEAALEG